MSKDDETTEKPTEEPKEPEAKRTRKIVRRSASTRDNPAFPEAAPAAEPAAPPAEAAPAAEPSAEKAPEAAPAPAEGAPRPRPRATFDARAPRPRPAPGEARPPRPGPDPRDRRGRGPGGGDFRPPPARPMGARPIPGGPRAPAPAGEGGERPHREHRPPRDDAGDFRPPPARPMGARPIPGGPRAPAPRSRDGGHPHAPGEGGERPRREHRPHPGDVARNEAPSKPEAQARPAAAAKPPPPAPAEHKAAKGPAHKAPAAKPIPAFIPLPRAGQVAATNKPALTPKEALAAKTKAFAAKAAKPAPKPSGHDGGPPATPGAPPAEAAPSFDPALVQASAEEAAAALGKAGDAASQLVDAWVAASNAAAIVEAAEADGVPSVGRKAARRALNVLRARGVALPTRSHVMKLDDRAEVSVDATFVPPDGSGVFVLTISRRDTTGRYRLAEVIAREQVGILQAGSGWLSGSKVKQIQGRNVDGLGVAPAPVPVDWARYRIAAARRQNGLTGQVLPLGFEGCRDVVEPAPDVEPPHPLADLIAEVTSERAATAAVMSANLHNEPEFASWLPDRPALDELLQKVGERLDPEDKGAPDKVAAVLDEETHAATDRFFSPEVRAVIAQRMRDAAITVRARLGARRASEVLAVARAVREAGLITAPPREIPFLIVFFQKALSLLVQHGGGQLRIPMRVGAAVPRAPEPPPEGSSDPSPAG